MNWIKVICLVLLSCLLASPSFTEEYPLQYFMEKSSLKTYDLSKKERTELLNKIERVLEQVKQIQLKLTRAIQEGETDIKYQEGRFWMAKLNEDQGSIDLGTHQVKILRETPFHLVAAVKLYKSLKDLSYHFNAYNNMSCFYGYIGDVAPELELWSDPIFYKLYLLPLAQAKNLETKTPPKEKKPEVKGKKQ